MWAAIIAIRPGFNAVGADHYVVFCSLLLMAFLYAYGKYVIY